jgi:hypothetical protein
MTLDQAIAATQNPEWLNPLFAVLHARSKDTPAKLWHLATPAHDSIFRALRMDRTEFGAFYAALPFRIARIDGKVRILAALPCPHFLDDGDDDWLRIETVLAWDPVANTAKVLDDASENHLIGSLPYDTAAATVHGSPFSFFREIAEARAIFFGLYCNTAGDWTRKPSEPDTTPGLLLLGDPAKVTWPLHELPDDLTTAHLDAKAVNRAMIRQARVPRARPGGAQ